MGKGGTKFSGDAVGSRTKWVGYTTKDARKVRDGERAYCILMLDRTAEMHDQHVS